MWRELRRREGGKVIADVLAETVARYGAVAELSRLPNFSARSPSKVVATPASMGLGTIRDGASLIPQAPSRAFSAANILCQRTNKSRTFRRPQGRPAVRPMRPAQPISDLSQV
jgi:hypothetical protein